MCGTIEQALEARAIQDSCSLAMCQELKQMLEAQKETMMDGVDENGCV